MKIESAAPDPSLPETALFAEEINQPDRYRAKIRPNHIVNICQVEPAHNPHAAALDDVAELLYRSAKTLGREARVHPNTLYPGALNILLGWHLLAMSQEVFEKIASCPTVIYQLEHFPALISREDNTRLLLAAKFHWDYSSANFADYGGIAGLRMVYIPRAVVAIGSLNSSVDPRNDADESERDIPVLFYGSMNHRRRKILDGIAAYLGTPNLTVRYGVYGPERDALIRRAKIVLNLHYYEQPRIFEQVRVAHLLDMGAFVVSEHSDDEPGWARELVTQCRPDMLPELCAMLLESGSSPARRYLSDRRHLDRGLFASRHAMAPALDKALRQVEAVLQLDPSNIAGDPVILPA